VGCSLHDGPGQQASGLAHVAVRPPERSQVRNLSEYLRLPSRRQEPTEAAPEVVELQLQPVEPTSLILALELPSGCLHEFEEAGCVPVAKLVQLSGLLELAESVLADCFEHRQPYGSVTGLTPYETPA